MLEGTLAVWFNIITIAILTFALANAAVSVVISALAQPFLELQVASRKTSLWLMVTLPWAASLCVTLCFIYKYYLAPSVQTTFSIAHWHHMTTFSLFSWHAITLLSALTFFGYVLFKKGIQLNQHRRQLSLLTALSQPLDNALFLIDAPYASAFTSGFINKRCFITSAMLSHTTAQEQAVIIGHEQAHAHNNDPIKKWIFSILAMFFVPSLCTRLKRHMTLAMEQEADNAVINEQIDPTIVASTLVKVARLSAAQAPILNNELVSNFGADLLEQRVYFLLGQLNLKPTNKLLTSLFITLTLILSIVSIDTLHHFIETIFKH